jgi:hypothetical protein
VATYLTLNVVVVAVGLWHLAMATHLVTDWAQALSAQHGSPLLMVAMALLVFPKLALGLSGFETGVAVMNHVQGDPDDTEERPLGRIRGTKKLLTTAALTMSVFLVASSLITTLLIPRKEFEPGGSANGRARLTSLTSTWATRSARSMTYPPSLSCGSRAPPPWRGCSTSCRDTYPATAWHRIGRVRCARQYWCSSLWHSS